MPEAIRAFCRKTGQPVPEDNGAVVRCALESVAMKFRQVLGMCEELSGGRIETIHIVGGGTKNRQLCQFAADACGRRVVAGPVEATATGNLMMQAVAAGDVCLDRRGPRGDPPQLPGRRVRADRTPRRGRRRMGGFPKWLVASGIVVSGQQESRLRLREAK